MSFARGDLARRAAIADDLALPEPWGANDDERVLSAIRRERERFRKLGITDEQGRGRVPDFLLDYENLPPKKPVALDRAHTRPSVATRWDQNGNLVETSADTLRLQRDPKTGQALGLLYEPKRTLLINSPQDITSSDWGKTNVSTNANQGTSKGQDYDELIENGGNSAHGIFDFVSTPTDEPLALSGIVKQKGREYILFQVNDSAGNTFNAWFDLSNGVTGTTNGASNISVISHDIDDLSRGWYRAKIVAEPELGESFDSFRLRLSNEDGVQSYNGDSSSGVQIIQVQAEVSREVTTPILQGGAVREADEVDYRFDFPDKTTGVACSIFQGSALSANVPIQKFGTTPQVNNAGHGVLMDGLGLNDDSSPQIWKRFTRNSDDVDKRGDSPRDETITQFAVYQDGFIDTPDAPSRAVRQIAIHTEPHTDAQLSDLESNYLTQP